MTQKQIGLIGLGKMGGNLALNLIDHGWEVWAYNRTSSVTREYESQGIHGVDDLHQLARSLTPPRLVWLMVSHPAVDAILSELINHLEANDLVIDGGNSFFQDSIRRSQELKQKQIAFLDAGVSGGPNGARHGACVMIGGDRPIFQAHEKLFQDISVPDGYAYLGQAGAGHFVKMVHNGIEYGMMQALAEGFNLMKETEFDLDLTQVADLYNHGSVIESRLTAWLKTAYEQSGHNLIDISGKVAQSGEGQWTIETAAEKGIPVPVIAASLNFRLQSQTHPSYIGQILSALRHQFGGHPVNKEHC